MNGCQNEFSIFKHGLQHALQQPTPTTNINHN